MKNVINSLKSCLFGMGPTVKNVEWISLTYTPCTQTHWCEVQTDLDEEIARA